MRVDRVGRNADDLGPDALELFEAVRKVDQLGRADKSEIERVKKQNEPFAPVVRKLDVLIERLDVLRRRHVEIRRRLTDLCQSECVPIAVTVVDDMYV